MFQRSSQERDTAKLRKEELLADYGQISSRRNLGAESTALRNNWPDFRDILAYQTSGGNLKYSELVQRVDAGVIEKSEIVSPEALGSLGIIGIISQGRLVEFRFGIAALQMAIDMLPKNRKSYRLRKLLTEYYLELRDRTLALEMLDLYPDIDREYYRYLRLDAFNPYIFPDVEIYEYWLKAFNEPLILNGLAPVVVEEGIAPPFARLTTERSPEDSVSQIDREAPLVSVVMATNNVQNQPLLSAIRSILDQTWSTFELILVINDGEALSPELQSLIQVDQRIRPIQLRTPRGLYVALNEGLKNSRGDFVTFQSGTDWSHPERIERQVTSLESSKEEIAGCIAQGVTTTLKLGRSVLGREPVFFNPHSLMLTRKGMDAVGQFLPVTSGGATELIDRFKEVSGSGITEMSIPLTLALVENEESLVWNSVFAWPHASYRMFQSSYRHWHKTAALPHLCLGEDSRPEVVIPSYLAEDNEPGPQHLDIVLAGDWTRFGGPQKSMLEEIRALCTRGFKVGVMSLEAGRFMEKVPRPLCAAVQALINTGQVTQVFPDEEIDVDLLVLRYPPILQFVNPEPMSIKAKQAIILANQAPSELDGSDIRYRIEDVNKNAEIFFDCPYTWVPQGPQVRDALIQGGLPATLLSPFDIPGIIEPDDWYTERFNFRGTIPVVGRHSRDNAMKWPDNATDLEKVYPVDGKLDVRIMGGAKAPMKVLGSNQIPAGWIVHEADEMPVKTFLGSLDYFVFFQHPGAVEAFGRAVLEAIASGVVVILPPHFERVFGRGAVYCDIEEVLPTIRSFHNDWEIYRQQVQRARKVIKERFSHEVYGRLIEDLIERSKRQLV